MPTINLSEQIRQDSKKVYEIIKDMAKFPEFIKGIKKLQVLSSSGNKIVTSWEIEINNTIVLWKEEDIFNDEKYRIDFNMLEGDYAQYTGSWEVSEGGQACRLNLSVTVDYGAPALMEFIGGLLEKKTTAALKGMLLAIKKKAEEA